MPKPKKSAKKKQKPAMEIIHPHAEIKLKKGQIIEITPDMLIGDVIMAYPEAGQVMREMGIHCVGCHGAAWESIEEGSAIHGIDPREICDKINETIKKTRLNNKKKK